MQAGFGFFFVPVFFAAVTASSTARADIPPYDGYEEQCTLEKMCPEGKECLSCPGRRTSDLPPCESTYANQGYTQACRTAGYTGWTEIWCRPVSDPSGAGSGGYSADTALYDQVVRCPDASNGNDAEQSDSSCSARPLPAGRTSSAPPGLWLASVALLLALRARRPRSG